MFPVYARPFFAAAAFLGAMHMSTGVDVQPEAKSLPAVAILPPLMALTAPMPDNIACHVLPEHTRLDYRLPRLGNKLDTKQPVVIVAVGSSSTAGAGASSSFAAYPARLQMELRRMFQSEAITVLNRGVNGEKAGDIQDRLALTVLDEKPDLVIFQSDVNSILADAPLAPAVQSMDASITALQARHIDVVLMDAQFAPRVNVMPNAGAMQEAVTQLGRDHRVGVFHRNDLMRHWYQKENLRYDQFLSPDELHMKDWSYACAARVLAHAIGEAASPYPVAFIP